MMDVAEKRNLSNRIKPRNSELQAKDKVIKSKQWTQDDLKKLLYCLKLYGHKDLDSIQKELPNKCKDDIKKYLMGVHSQSRSNIDTNCGLNYWLCRSKGQMDKSKIANIYDHYQIAQVIKFLSIDGLFERHPPPENCDGIDFVAAYNLLFQALMGYPLQPVNKETSAFIYDCLCSLKIDKNIVSEMTEFIKNHLSADGNTNQTESSSNPSASGKISNYDQLKKKPLAVYQRKRPVVPINDKVPSVKVVLEDTGKTAMGNMKCFSVEVEGKQISTPVLVPVLAPPMKKMRLEEEFIKLTNSTGYNPFELPIKYFNGSTSSEQFI